MLQTKVLLVDDEQDFSIRTKNLLERNQFQVTTCQAAEEAFLHLRKDFFDIVICDVFIPFFGHQEGGLEIAKEVAEKHPASFTIIVSQYVTEALVNKFLGIKPHSNYRFLNKDENFENSLIDTVKKGIEKKYVLVCMPFSDEFNDIYQLGIKAAVTELGFQCERADEIQYSGGIIDKIYDLIKSAHLIVADMTTKNPNVFYEVGYAHAIGKEVILLTQKVEDIPVDLRNFRHIIYDGKILKLKEELKKMVEALYR